MEAIIDKNSYITGFVGVLLILMALTDILQTRSLLIVSSALSVSIFIFCFPLKNKYFLSESMTFILFLLITSLVNLFFTQNNFGGSLTLTGNLFLSFLYLQTNNTKKLTLWIIAAYLITILFISFHLFILGTHENFIYEGLSRNHAGFAVVFWTIFLLFHLKVTYNRFPLLIPLIGLTLSFFLVGRTSLIVSALLILVVFFYKFYNLKVRIVALTVFLGICYFLWSKFGSDLITETNLDAGLDTPRWKLWSIYWKNIDFVNLLTGVDVTKLPMYDQYSGNPHNSFIKFHSRVGIGSIVFIVLLFVSSFKYLHAKEYYIFWLLILLTLRASFDGDMLIGNFDFIFLIITFYWIKTD